MQKIQMVDLHGQYLKIKDKIDNGIAEVINSCAFVGGTAVHKFADDLANYLDVKHVTPCGNGTDALQIALMALDLKPGDEVITAAHTFVATAEVIALLGLKPVFIDIDPQTFTIDVTLIEAAITPRTKCIIPVHLYGQSADMQPIMEIAKKHNLYVVEDNAQAIGSDYYFADGTSQKAGTIGHIGTTSFYPSKNLGCYGDGGALFTNDPVLGEQIKCVANHGQRKKYVSDLIGVNSRMDSMQAAVLSAKLPHLDTYNQTRQAAADYYDQAFAQHPKLTLPHRAAYSTHVFHQYTLVVDGDRDLLKAQLWEAGIPSMIYYPIPLHLQKAYQHLIPEGFSLPVTEKMAKQVISLPMHSELNEDILQHITHTFLNLLENI